MNNESIPWWKDLPSQIQQVFPYETMLDWESIPVQERQKKLLTFARRLFSWLPDNKKNRAALVNQSINPLVRVTFPQPPTWEINMANADTSYHKTPLPADSRERQAIYYGLRYIDEYDREYRTNMAYTILYTFEADNPKERDALLIINTVLEKYRNVDAVDRVFIEELKADFIANPNRFHPNKIQRVMSARMEESRRQEAEQIFNTFTEDMTEEARRGQLPLAVGRDRELEELLIALRAGDNPLLLGEPGVGKTALVDRLVHAIAAHERGTEFLANARIVRWNLASMTKGEGMYVNVVQARVIQLMEYVKDNNIRVREEGVGKKIYLLVDELHAAFAINKTDQQPPIGDFLKTFLTNSDISIIGATTQSEYKEYIMSDPAMDSRMKRIFMNEPSREETLEIVSAEAVKFAQGPEGSETIDISPEILTYMLDMLDRYRPSPPYNPRKAVNILKAACSAIRHQEAVAPQTIGEEGLKLTERHITKVLASECGIPEAFFTNEKRKHFGNAAINLAKDIVGQAFAVTEITKYLRLIATNLKRPKGPLFVGVLVGTTGVGKTETAKSLARSLFGSEDKLIQIKLNDYQTEESEWTLFGSAKGYINNAAGGKLTEAIRRNPYCVLLLDEIEKATPEINLRLMNLFEDGILEDGMGNIINCKNVLVLAASNAGAVEIVEGMKKDNFVPEREKEWAIESRERYKAALEKMKGFPQEVLNRLDALIPYAPLLEKYVKEIVERAIQGISLQIEQEYGIAVTLSDEVVNALINQKYNLKFGARDVIKVVGVDIMVDIANWIIENDFYRGDAIGGRLHITQLENQETGAGFVADLIR